jgi:phosphopantothenoylcysteine decarboxylase/phosphopantothenate--cysteine ligase
MRILITAGPTREAIDPVRYLSNHSSGKMGYALAAAAQKMGHHVMLISGPTALKPPPHVEFVPIISAQDMFQAVMKNYKSADVMIKVAAVADYRPQVVAKQKIKKTKNVLNLKLVKNPDILRELGKKKKLKQILVGFAAETRNSLAFAREKLKSKNCDWMIVNDVAKKGIGFGSNENAVTLLNKDGTSQKLPKNSKQKIAQQILKLLLR